MLYIRTTALAITIAQIRKSIHEGVRIANDKCDKLTDGYWLMDAGVEGFMVGEIVAQLRKRMSRNEIVFPELSFRDIGEWSEFGRPPGRPFKETNDRFRVDICLINRERRPKYVIEVKRSWDDNEKECLRDLMRIRGLVRTYPAIECGFFAVFLARPVPSGGVSGKIKEIAGSVGHEFENEGVDINFSSGRIIKKDPSSARRVWQVSSLSIEISARR